MDKRVLIVDGDKSLVVALALLLDNVGITAINSGPVTDKENVSAMITYYRPDVILLDHNLSDHTTGLDIIEIIPKNILVLLTSILVTSSRELTDSYRNIGVHHFPGKIFSEIMKCIEGNCGCYSPLVSFLP